MARYVAEGAHVTLLTCTRGEEGEVLVPELEHLAAARDDELGPHREGELAAAMAVLGVTDHRFLGGAGRWRDSGMMGRRRNDRPDCFWRADLLEAATELVAVVREVRPQVLRHLRHLRRVRPPRPHPGAPGRDVRAPHWPPRRRSGPTSVRPGTCRRSTGRPSPGRTCWRGVWRRWPRPGRPALFGVENAEDLPFAVDDGW